MSRWTHPQCERCWVERESEWDGNELVAIRRPTRINSDDAEVEVCCYCSHATFVGIYRRDDPATLPCKGEHKGEDE